MARPIAVARHPILSIVLPVPVVCFLAAVLTDLSYANSDGNLLWLNLSSWLIAAGLTFGVVAMIILLVDALRRSANWLAFLLVAAAWAVEFVNALVHARDGWTAVVRLGLTLSIIGAVLILVGGWLCRSTAGEVR
jgi:uncharacterized membrane protein